MARWELRDNHEGMLEIVTAYERDGFYFGVVRVQTPSETAAFEFGVAHEGYLALRKISNVVRLGVCPAYCIPSTSQGIMGEIRLACG
jgi:hypothetical protein